MSKKSIYFRVTLACMIKTDMHSIDLCWLCLLLPFYGHTVLCYMKNKEGHLINQSMVACSGMTFALTFW